MKKIALALCLLFLSAYPRAPQSAYTWTHEQCVDEIREWLDDEGPSTDEEWYTDVDICRKIIAVEDEAVSKTGALQAQFSTTTSPGTREYSLPSDCFSRHIYRVSYYISSSTSDFKRLNFATLDSLDIDNSTWESVTDGLPREYYVRENKIGLYPTPSASYSTTTWNCLKVDYIQNPTDVSTTTMASTYPFNNDTGLYSFHPLVVKGVVAYITNDKELKAEYYALLSEMKKELKEIQDLVSKDQLFPTE